MTEKANIDYVTEYPRLDASWAFEIEDHSTDLRSVHQNMLQIATRVSEIFNCLYKPQKIEIGFLHYPEEVPIEEMYDFENIEIDGETHEIDLSETSVNDALNQFTSPETSAGQPRIINNISFGIGATKLYIDGENRLIDRNNTTHYKLVDRRGDTEILGEPDMDPLRIDIEHGSEIINQISSPTKIHIGVSTETDMWFEDSSISAINRGRLVSCLHQLEADFTPYAIDFFADAISPAKLEREDYLADLAIHSRE
ncbi:hypothetical protein ELS19_15570 [Halogeometricum borinquense]|uniref:Uncharacterized protein n=1 Tax=Halogeometricum borinquense TaxID=60847 RepID=A0A482TQP1_9EURY|nr:hypothetical protein [Halogeometricum borinquense]RYJ15225.1 hypothetical protein ELS19_15570 [Halogeometricum borinquense]